MGEQVLGVGVFREGLLVAESGRAVGADALEAEPGGTRKRGAGARFISWTISTSRCVRGPAGG